VKKQHQLHQQRLKNPTQENIARHTRFRNQLEKLIKKEKKAHIMSKMERFRNEPKQQVKVLREVMSQKNNTRTSPTELQYNGDTLTHPQQIADALNNHYITIGGKTANTTPPQQNLPPRQQPTTTTLPPFQLSNLQKKKSASS
jgi:hypothetical protein